MKMPGGKELDAKIVALLEVDESPVFDACPKYANFGRGTRLTLPTLLLTNRRLLLYKDRLFRARFDFAVEWSNVGTVEGDLWRDGDGRSIQLLVRDPNGSVCVELIVLPQYAVDVESAIRSGYMDGRNAL
jgi:hypothetical protein